MCSQPTPSVSLLRADIYLYAGLNTLAALSLLTSIIKALCYVMLLYKYSRLLPRQTSQQQAPSPAPPFALLFYYLVLVFLFAATEPETCKKCYILNELRNLEFFDQFRVTL